MIRLISKRNNADDGHTISQYTGPKQHIFDTMWSLKDSWPGIKQLAVWYTDPVFGKYHDQEQLSEMQMEAAEEETDEYKDAEASPDPIATVDFEEIEKRVIAAIPTTDEDRESILIPSGGTVEGTDQEQSVVGNREGSNIDSDRQTEVQADTDESDSDKQPVETGSMDSPEPEAQRGTSLPLIKIKVRS